MTTDRFETGELCIFNIRNEDGTIDEFEALAEPEKIKLNVLYPDSNKIIRLSHGRRLEESRIFTRKENVVMGGITKVKFYGEIKTVRQKD